MAKKLLGRYEENAYFWRMINVEGNTCTTFPKLKGYDHGSMAGPPLPLLPNFIKSHGSKSDSQ